MSDLSVITVTHQSAPFLEELVFSVRLGAMKCSVEHVIVDNGSTDGTGEKLETEYGEFVRVIRNEDNRGFSAANNQGVALATGRYLLFLNPDMRVQEGSLDRLVEWMERHPMCGIASCLLVDPLGRVLQHSLPRSFPKWWREVLWLLRLDGWGRREYQVRGEEVVEMVKGAFMLVRREVVEKLGFAFDPRYFLMFEDTDLCREVKRLGYQVVFHPDVQCIDYNSRSFATKSGKWIYRHFTRSMFVYFQKWEGWPVALLIAICIPIGALLRMRADD